jgi:short-subunit dehydrogenase
MLQLDKDIKFNPQKYYISIRKTRNFAYVELRKKKINIVIMLPYEVESKLIKRHTITKLSESVQNWYGTSGGSRRSLSQYKLARFNSSTSVAIREAFTHTHIG